MYPLLMTKCAGDYESGVSQKLERILIHHLLYVILQNK